MERGSGVRFHSHDRATHLLPVQFFFNETKSKDEVSRFWLWDSHRENPVGDVEKRLPYLPQDRRSRSDPYLGIPPR